MTAPSDIAEIRRIVAAHVAGLHDKDVDAVMAHVDDDILSYDLAPPLASRGAETYRRNLEAWFPTWDGPIDYEQTDLEITVGGDVAFTTAYNRLGGAKKGEGTHHLWVRITAGLKKIGGPLGRGPRARLRAVLHGWQPESSGRPGAATLKPVGLPDRRLQLETGLDRHREIDRIGEEALRVRLVMQARRQDRVRPRRQPGMGPQRDHGEAPSPIGGFQHLALGLIIISGDDDAGLGAQMQIPELVAGAERSDQQLLGVPARGVAAEGRVG